MVKIKMYLRFKVKWFSLHEILDDVYEKYFEKHLTFLDN